MKKQQIRKLTWKYFIKQKFLELLTIPIMIGVLYLTSYFGRYIDVFFSDNKKNLILPTMDTFLEHMAYGIIGFCESLTILLFIYLVGTILYAFIKWNWNKANKRAKEKLK